MAIPNPLDAVRLASTVYGAVEQAIKLIPRVTTLLTDVERLVLRVNTLMSEVEGVVAAATGIEGRVSTLVDRFQPVLDRLLPVLETLARTTSDEEVAAIVKLIDALPPLVDRLDADIMPVLDTLATVAPDLRDLLDVSRELNEIIGAVPGLRGVKRRAEEKQVEEQTYRADEEPASAPQRKHPEASTPPTPPTPAPRAPRSS